MTESSALAPDPAASIVAGALGLWFFAALALSLSGVYYGVPAPVVGGTNGLLVAGTLLAIWLIRPLRAWAMTVSLRWLVGYHTVRFVGVAFLALHASGALPADFAIVSGWGDIAVAVGALVVAFAAVPVTTSARWWAVLGWNVFGLADILLVIGTAIRLGLADYGQVAVMTAFPMSLLPTFVVPLVIVTHVLIFVRLGRGVRERETAR